MSQNNRPRVLFDLCDIEEIRHIENLPPELLLANPHTGRVILDESDPWVTKLCLMGFKPIYLQWLPGGGPDGS